MTKPYDLFISYATEDEAYATELCNDLRFFGFRVWFAPLSLKIGDKLLDSINAGLIASEFGLLLLSPAYISKQWTSYELDVLHRQHVEQRKKLFPVWHGVDKSQIDKWNPGLSGIIALKSGDANGSVAKKIADIIYQDSPTRGIAPSWEDPQWRFLKGCGELLINNEDGPAFNLFEAAEFPEEYFPLFVKGRQHSRRDLVLAVAAAFYYQNPDVIQIAADRRARLVAMCKAHGFDLDDPNFDPAVHG